MTDSIKIHGPVKIQSESVAQVAFDLMEKIAFHEPKETHPRSREYWIKLYYKCHQVASGYSPE